ncbi:MAG: acetyl-CoA carboxylase biotin carboxyl carrier protein subunit [Firmicutes bacterium CAG:552_39_19]|nr:MAG: acetyl-CoA carboxylase biotin carboxyl carrier protein subunit [Firmicutes bacterium CAG:552_39_19]
MRKFNVNVNGKSYYVEVEEASSTASAQPAAVTAPAPVAAAPAPAVATPAPAVAMPAPAAKPAGGVAVVSPMPGQVLRFIVSEGASVKKGEKIIVIEAMKMENEIVASADGVVSFAVKKGDNIDTGVTLAYIG